MELNVHNMNVSLHRHPAVEDTYDVMNGLPSTRETWEEYIKGFTTLLMASWWHQLRVDRLKGYTRRKAADDLVNLCTQIWQISFSYPSEFDRSKLCQEKFIKHEYSCLCLLLDILVSGNNTNIIQMSTFKPLSYPPVRINSSLCCSSGEKFD